MNDLMRRNQLQTKTRMWLSVGVLYIMLGLASVGLLFLENSAALPIVGLVCTCAVFHLLALLIIGRQERIMGCQPLARMPSPALAKAYLPLRVAGILLAILSLAGGCFILAMLWIEWTDTLEPPVLSLVLGAAGLFAVLSGSLFGYSCVTGKGWPIESGTERCSP